MELTLRNYNGAIIKTDCKWVNDVYKYGFKYLIAFSRKPGYVYATNVAPKDPSVTEWDDEVEFHEFKLSKNEKHFDNMYGCYWVITA